MFETQTFAYASKRSASLMKRLKSGEILVFDGATGTYLQANGLEPGGCPELFNLEKPEIVTGMANAYFSAGSDAVLTNSFGGNRFMLAKYKVADKTREINRTAAANAREAAPDDNHFVCGSMGPTGEFMEPLGTVSESQMYDVLAEQASALAEGGSDAIMIETQFGLEEARVAIRAARENTNVPIMSTMVFDLGPRGYFTMMGVTPEQAAKGLREAGADVVGSNCGNGVDRMVEIANKMRSADAGLMAIQSNAGMPKPTKGGMIYPETPEYMAERYKALSEIPINILGGCCGTQPEHIATLRKTLDRRTKS